MKYYLYIADKKVDMLLPQIPMTAKQKVSSELGFDLKLLSGKIASERQSLEDRVSRVEAVAAYLRTHEDIGTVENHKSWIALTDEARVGYFHEDQHVVAFAGSSAGSRFLFAGSAAHVIGADSPHEAIRTGYSFVPRLLHYFQNALEYFEKDWLTDEQMRLHMGEDDSKGHNWMQLVWIADQKLSGPTQRIETLVKTLLTGRSGQQQCYLGTPLYVATQD